MLLGSAIALAGCGLILFASRLAARTDPINQKLTGRVSSGRRGYVLVGAGLFILGIAIAGGWA